MTLVLDASLHDDIRKLYINKFLQIQLHEEF